MKSWEKKKKKKTGNGKGKRVVYEEMNVLENRNGEIRRLNSKVIGDNGVGEMVTEAATS